ncbi:hypothetical protein QL285_095957 [Trifolium repens]|nr:hypothetical protein QL285_095957 [Trifolium repens]
MPSICRCSLSASVFYELLSALGLLRTRITSVFSELGVSFIFSKLGAIFVISKLSTAFVDTSSSHDTVFIQPRSLLD